MVSLREVPVVGEASNEDTGRQAMGGEGVTDSNAATNQEYLRITNDNFMLQ